MGAARDGSARYKLELGRAERLFGAKRYAQARDAFAACCQSRSLGDDQELVALRLAECDYYLQALSDARAMRWRRGSSTARRRAEAQFFYLSATRELGERCRVRAAGRGAGRRAFPGDSWTEETLNNLATHYILTDDDDSADADVPPAGAASSRRAATRSARAWKIGWNAYRTGKWADCADTFERAAARVSAIRLPPAVDLLGRPLARAAWRRAASPIGSTASSSPTT